MTPEAEARQRQKLHLLKQGGAFYLVWLVVGFVGFGYAGLNQDFYATDRALELSVWVALALSVPILIPAFLAFPKVSGLRAFASTIAKYAGACLFVPAIFIFFTYFWLPRVIHTLLAEEARNSYTVASRNERPVTRGCNTHYWIMLEDWPDYTREKVCIEETAWANVKPGDRVTTIESVSALGSVIYALKVDG